MRQADEHEARGVATEYARIPDEPDGRGYSGPTVVYRLAGAWKTAPYLPLGAVGEDLAAVVGRLRAAVDDGDQNPISHADVRAVLEALVGPGERSA